MRSLLVITLLVVCSPATGQLTELSPDTWDAEVPQGKEIDAIYGDYAIGNNRARGIIAAPNYERNANMTVRGIAGCLIDFVTRDYESDQLSAFFPGRREYRIRDVKAGATGSVIMVAPAAKNRPEYVIEYVMEPGQPVISITSTWTNTNRSDITLRLEDGLRIDRGNQDMEYSPAGTESLYWIHDLHWQQAYAIRAPGFEVNINDNDRETILKWIPEGGEALVVKPDDSWSLKRQLIVARDMPEVRAIINELDASDSVYPVTVRVADSSGRPVANARLTLSSQNEDRGTSTTNEDGILTARLPVGDWQVDGTHYQRTAEHWLENCTAGKGADFGRVR